MRYISELNLLKLPITFLTAILILETQVLLFKEMELNKDTRIIRSPNFTTRLNRRRFRNFGWVIRTTRLNLRDGLEPCIRISEPLLKYHFYKSEFNVNDTAKIACF
jgi:hypothetical protein